MNGSKATFGEIVAGISPKQTEDIDPWNQEGLQAPSGINKNKSARGPSE